MCVLARVYVCVRVSARACAHNVHGQSQQLCKSETRKITGIQVIRLFYIPYLPSMSPSVRDREFGNAVKQCGYAKLL